MISNQQVKTILQDWSYWDSPPKLELTRQVSLPKALRSDLVLIIQGVRRCGKSTLLSQLPSRYQLPLSQCYYCNFEDPRLLNDLNHHLLTQITSIARESHQKNVPCYFFLDEIQHVEAWEKWLHAQLERPSQDYYILTGSNSCLLSGEFATALTGRHITVNLYPFSLTEFKLLCTDKNLEDYLNLGGFPRPLSYEKPYQLLQEYFNDIILRDVLKRVRARSSDSIKHVAKIAFESCGSELSYRKIAATAGLTVDTVITYLNACEQAFLLFSCPYFAFSEKKRLARQKKFYPIDPGLRHAVISSTGCDYGKSLELLIYLRLKQENDQVYYWQETHKGEVDFVTVQGKKITPYQVTWDIPQPRHEKSLNYFYESFPQAEEAIFITKDDAPSYL